jgi:hypothetical protein
MAGLPFFSATLKGHRSMDHVASDILIIHLPTNKMFGIKYCVFWVRVGSIFSAITDTKIT